MFFVFPADVTQLQHIPLELGSPIVHASTADPYLALLADDGQVIMLMLRETKGTAKLVVSKSTLANVSFLKLPSQSLLYNRNE